MDSVGIVTREDGTGVSKVVSSIASGSESISFATGSSGGTESIYGQAAVDKKVESVLLYQVAMEYLSGVTDNKGICLLYAGM